MPVGGDDAQPARNARPTNAAINSEERMRVLFLPNSNNAAASAEPGSQELGPLRSEAEPEAIVMVKVETIAPLLTEVGEKLHVAPVGRPEQARAIVDEVGNPFAGVTVMVSVPVLPAVTVSVGAETAMVKSGVGGGLSFAVTVNVAVLLVIDPPAELVTTTLNCAPLSAEVVAGVV